MYDSDKCAGEIQNWGGDLKQGDLIIGSLRKHGEGTWVLGPSDQTLLRNSLLTLTISPLHPADESGLHLSSARPGWARAGAPDAVPVMPLTCCLAVSCNHSPPHLWDGLPCCLLLGTHVVERTGGFAQCPLVLGSYCHQLEREVLPKGRDEEFFTHHYWRSEATHYGNTMRGAMLIPEPVQGADLCSGLSSDKPQGEEYIFVKTFLLLSHLKIIA